MTRIDYIKGKPPTKAKKGKTSSKQETLELIHTDINGPFTRITITGYNCFITFIDEYSKFRWVKLLIENFESLDAFKVFKAIIKLKYGNKIICVNSNKGKEYYNKYDETIRNLGPFTKYLQQWH